MWRATCALIFLLAPALADDAQARVLIKVDLGSQTMQVRDGGTDYVWPVSTARSGFVTPRGDYRARRLVRMHYSRKYNGSPMPHSIFFAGGYAIHGSYETRALGHPASHGCVRLSPAHAAMLYAMVRRGGADIRISGSPPRDVAHTRIARKSPAARESAVYPDYDRPERGLAALDGLASGRSAAGPRARRSANSLIREDAWDGWR